MTTIYKKDGIELLSPCCNDKMYEIHYHYTSINCSKCKQEHMESDIIDYNKNKKTIANKIVNGNVLIAHFMGLKRGDDWEVRSEKADWCHPMDLKYNTSWDWLFPVSHKIEELGFEIFFKSKSGMVTHSSKKIVEYKSEFPISRIELFFGTILEFIETYYKNNRIEKPKPIEFYEG